MAGEISTEAQRRIALITTAQEERHGVDRLRDLMTNAGHVILGTYPDVNTFLGNYSGELNKSDVVVHYEPIPRGPLGEMANSLTKENVPGARVYITLRNPGDETKAKLKESYDAVACGVEGDREALFHRVATETIPRAEPYISQGVGSGTSPTM